MNLQWIIHGLLIVQKAGNAPWMGSNQRLSGQKSSTLSDLWTTEPASLWGQEMI